MRRFPKFLLLGAVFLAAVAAAPAATIVVGSNSNWSSLTGGSGPAGVPDTTDSVMVTNGATLTVDATNAQCASLQLGATSAAFGNGTLAFQSNSQLTCATNMILGSGDRTGSLDFTAGGRLRLGGSVTVAALGVFTAGTGTIEYVGASTQAVTSALGDYNHLTVNGAGPFLLSASVSVNGTLTLASGVLTTGTNTLTITTGGSVSGGNAASHVNGRLRKDFSAGDGQSFMFAVGDGLSYSPINLTALNVTSPGSLTARATAGDHPLVGSSPLNLYQSVNRYWTLTNSPAGIAVATNLVTFNYVGVGADVDANVNTSTFMVGRYDGTWSTNTVAARTATNTSVLAVTAFGDFAIGNQTYGGPVSYTTNTVFFTYTNRAALLADGWDFMARATNGSPRDTETTAGTSPPDVAYARTNADFGTVLRIPAGTGDLWMSANNTRNSLFRNLSPDWASVRLQVAFAPTQPFQQMQLVLYQDDNNYAEIGSVYTYPTNPIVTFSQETNGVPHVTASTALAVTNLFLRLDRDLYFGLVMGFYSLDGTNWVALGHVDQDFVNPRLAIWAGGSPSGFPSVDLYRLDIVTSDTPVVTALDFQRSTFVFSGVAGQPCTNLQRARVIHRGPAGLHWTLTNTASWLSTSVTNGDGATAFDLSVNTTGLPAGIYETALKFGAPGAANDPATFNVRLILNPDVRARAATWRGGKKAAMSVWVDDSSGVMFNIMQTNGYTGSYLLWGVDATHFIPTFFTNYYNAGMELGAHTVHHVCNELMDERELRSEIESNVADILKFTPARREDLITFAFPCGVAGVRQKAAAADYFLITRGYNVNQLEDPSPYDWMFLKAFNSHENDPSSYNPACPPNPADFKTIVDDAIAQGKWANLVFHGLNNDDGAVAYSVGKDIWVARGGVVGKYVLQRDRTVISNYVETTGDIRFDCYRFPLERSILRDFETSMTTNDLLTLQVKVTGIPAVTNVTVDGLATTNYAIRTVGGETMLFLDTLMTATPKRIELGVSNITNHPPVLATNADVAIGEGQTLILTNSATDPETNALTFSLGAGAPAGMTINSSGVLNWTPGETNGGSNFIVTVIVTDNGLPALSASNSFTVIVNEINQPPVLSPQSDRIMVVQTLLTVVNAATDADLPANSLGYTLLAGPTNAVINSAGVITWTPVAEQAPSTNTFTTVVTDTNPLAVNAQNLSATNSFIVAVTANPLSLPAQTNRTLDELTLLIVTNTATHLGLSTNDVGQVVSNTFNFTYANRDALLADGWDFLARTTNSSPRDTERTNGAVVSYDQFEHPGSLRIPVDIGDLWAAADNSRNSLFRNISSNWVSARLLLSFSPTQNYQQVQFALYQDDGNYLQAGFGYNTNLGGRATTLIRELNGSPVLIGSKSNSTSTLQLRLDRNATNGNVSAFYSPDETNWISIASAAQSFANPRLGIWTGGSASGFPNLDLTRLDVVVSNPPNRVNYQLIAPPAGAVISPNGVITWTPDASQGPGVYSITTVASDLSEPPLMVTNTFTVVVNDVVPSVVRITDIKLNNGNVIVTWDAISNRTYRVQQRTNLISAAWSDVPPDLTATGSSASKTNSLGLSQSFYRVVLLP